MASSAKHRFKKSHLVRFVSWLVFHNPVDLLASAFPVRKRSGGRKRVVFIKMDGIGDHIIWTASFGLIERLYPAETHELILVSNERNRDLAGSADLFEQKYYVDARSFASSPTYRFQKLREIKSLGADVVINPRTTRDFLWGDSLVRASGAPIRIGSVGINNLMSPLQERISARWYTELRPAPAENMHELAANAEFLGADGSEISLPLRIEAAAASGQAALLPDEDHAVIFVGAFTEDKRWPVASFAEAAKIISREIGLKIVLCGGPGENELGVEFARYFDGEFVDLIGKSTLIELSEVVSRAKLIVSNDTSAGHIAVAQGCPAIVVTPGNHVGRYYPYPGGLSEKGVKLIAVTHEMPCFGCGWNCIYTELAEDLPKPCIANVTPQDVARAATKLLGGHEV